MNKATVAIMVGVSLLGMSKTVEAKDLHSAKFKNCTALNAKYPGGVAKNAASADKQKVRPRVNAKVYNENKGLDRDKDGVACEK